MSQPRTRRPSAAVVLAVLALVLAATAGVFAATGTSLAGGGLRASTTPKARGVLRLDRRADVPVAAIPTVQQARTALRVRGLSAQDATLGCPSGAADLGTWCLDRGVRGVATHAAAARACVHRGGRLPTAGQLIGAAERLSLSGRADDRPSKAIVDARRDLRELSSTLVTTTTGSAASGSNANPTPSTLQYVTVFDNGNAGGFAGGVPVGSAERYRCAYLQRQPGAGKG